MNTCPGLMTGTLRVTDEPDTAMLKALQVSATQHRQLVELERQKQLREITATHAARRASHPNPLARYGRQVYSQSDEDGITLEILRRIGLNTGCFAEFGVGDGTENNSLVLLALGRRGLWIGVQDLAYVPPQDGRLTFRQDWVTADNVVTLGTPHDCGLSDLDVVSVDLDGNDLYFCKALLDAGARPSLFICEYNAKFPPPIRFSIEYDPAHEWQNDDYVGTSLQSLIDLFAKFDYALVCCNAATGVNAFFVRKDQMKKFTDVPETASEIYADPFYQLIPNMGHPRSVRTILNLIK